MLLLKLYSEQILQNTKRSKCRQMLFRITKMRIRKQWGKICKLQWSMKKAGCTPTYETMEKCV